MTSWTRSRCSSRSWLDSALSFVIKPPSSKGGGGFMRSEDAVFYIEIDYLEGRNRSCDVFKAMGSYVEAFEDLFQIIVKSSEIDGDFAFAIEGVEQGCIIAKFKSAGSAIVQGFFGLMANSAMDLVDNLQDRTNVDSVEDLVQLSDILQASIDKNTSKSDFGSYVDPKDLARPVRKICIANKKIRDGESVVIGNIQNKRSSSVNVGLRFDKRLKDIFNSASKEFQGVDLVYADKTVNSGDDEWTFRSKKSGFKYVAKLEDFEWLAKYQRGEIKPIGPHDLITVLVRYNYDSYHGKTTRPFDAVITKVERVDYEQEQLVRNLF